MLIWCWKRLFFQFHTVASALRGSAVLPEIYSSQSKGLAGGKNSHFARDLRTTVSKRPIEDATGSKTGDQRMIMSEGEDVSRCLDALVEAKPSPTSIRSKSQRKRKGGSREGQQPKD
ncbi:hypothetical protein B0H14DRAFT_3024953 [Mycena olivaceomarginata]|nr:hypothetical protein B0H14DRAFT_3024953 [Mycena olivaceomarginata]